MPEEQWDHVPTVGEVVTLDISSVVGSAVAGMAVVGVGPVTAQAIVWEPVNTEE